ncbi:MAG: DUF58 domain-containing protein [Planctomycetota bacterium]
MPAASSGRRRAAARGIRRYHLQRPFWVYIGLTLLVALAAVAGQNNLLYWIFGVMAAALVISGMVSGVTMSGLRVRRLDPQHGLVGESLAVRYVVINRNRLVPAFNIHIEERAGEPQATWGRLTAPAAAWVMHIGPREKAHGEAVFWPSRRGEARFDQLRVWTTFPFGMIKKSITLSQPQHTLIYPRRYQLGRRVLEALAPEAPIGAKISRLSGAGDDYYGMREYRAGDSLRSVAWKRSACLDQLICVERSRSTPPKLRVALNLTAEAPEGPDALRSSEEKAISLAASIIHAADLAGFEVALSVLGPEPVIMPIRRSKWHLDRIMGALARIDLAAPRGKLRGRRLIPDAERAGLVVVHPDGVDPRLGRSDAWHLSAAQLESLTVRPIGWDPSLPRAVGSGAASDAPVGPDRRPPSREKAA